METCVDCDVLTGFLSNYLGGDGYYLYEQAARSWRSELAGMAYGEAKTAGLNLPSHEFPPILRRPDSLLMRPEHDAVAGCSEALEMLMGVANTAMQHEHTIIPQPQDIANYIKEKKAKREEYAHAKHMAESGDQAAQIKLAQMEYFGAQDVERDYMNLGSITPTPFLTSVVLVIVGLIIWHWKKVQESDMNITFVTYFSCLGARKREFLMKIGL